MVRVYALASWVQAQRVHPMVLLEQAGQSPITATIMHGRRALKAQMTLQDAQMHTNHSPANACAQLGKRQNKHMVT